MVGSQLRLSASRRSYRSEVIAVLIAIAVAVTAVPLLGLAINYIWSDSKVESSPRPSSLTSPQGVEVVTQVEVRDNVVFLPLPRVRKEVLSVEEALAYRRSIRSYRDEPITIEHLSQLLWAAYGINEPRRGFKTTPSAGATYPLVIYAVIGSNGVSLGNGSFLKPGSYRYDPYSHSIQLVKEGDLRENLARAALNQEWVRDAPVNIVICAVFERTTGVYGERGYRYVHIEVGHVGQNIYLEATALGLGTVAVGAFYDDAVQRVIGAKVNEHPLYIMPVGVPLEPYRVSEQEIWRFIEAHRG